MELAIYNRIRRVFHILGHLRKGFASSRRCRQVLSTRRRLQRTTTEITEDTESPPRGIGVKLSK
jgi:hypothetical protein